MKISTARKLVDKAATWLLGKVPADTIEMRDTMSSGDGSTRIESGGKLNVYVGIAGFDPDSDMDIRDGEAIVPFVALFHEVAGHVMQMRHEFNKPTTLSKILFVSDCACKGSPRYYGIDDDGIPHSMYFKHPHEIAAQYMGIKCGYEYLTYAFGSSEKADSMMMDYISYRRECGCSFLPDSADPKSTVDVLDELNKTFQRQVHADRDFNPEYDMFDALNMADARRSRVDLFNRIKHCNDGVRQDYMMASAFFENCGYLFPDDMSFLLNTDVYKHLDMSIVKAFGSDRRPVWSGLPCSMTNLEKLRSVISKMDESDISKDFDDLSIYI